MASEYTINVKLKLRIVDAQDEYHASELIDSFLYGVSEMCYSSDEHDDHYRLDGAEIDYTTFTVEEV